MIGALRDPVQRVAEASGSGVPVGRVYREWLAWLSHDAYLVIASVHLIVGADGREIGGVVFDPDDHAKIVRDREGPFPAA